jgi:hypothetical protein
MKALSAATVAVILLISGCAQPRPPAPSPVREETVVNAGFAGTWDATIDHFAEDNIPISTIDRASGFIATTRLAVDRGTAAMASDCGSGQGLAAGIRVVATQAIYNVLVRGDEESSTVRVTASWSNPEASWACTTTGVWETEMEGAIKRRAEGGGDPTEIEIDPADQPEPEPSILFPGAPFAVPGWAKVIAPKSGSTFYPLIETYKAWFHLSEENVRYFASPEHARRAGLHESRVAGCVVG